jgi:hypothetical protein
VIDDGDADIDRFPPERLYSVRIDASPTTSED